MDRVQAFLYGLGRHHYWILALIVVVLPIWAWNAMATSANTYIGARKTAIQQAESQLQNVDGPNENWITGAAAFNEKNETQQEASINKLFKSQKIELTWPESVRDRVEELDLQYRQTFNDYIIRRAFAGSIPGSGKRQDDGYNKELEKLAATLEPYSLVTNTGKVLFDQQAVVKPYKGSETWVAEPPTMPTDQDMWDALEDLALQTSVINALREVNSSAIDITEAPIKQIQNLTLDGGEHSNFRDPAGYTQVDIAEVGIGAGASSGPLTDAEINRRMMQKLREEGGGGMVSRSDMDELEEEVKTEADAAKNKGGPNSATARTLGTNGNLAAFSMAAQFGVPRLDEGSAEWQRAQETKKRQQLANKPDEEDERERGDDAMAAYLAQKAQEAKEAEPELDKIAVDTKNFVKRKESRYIDLDDTKPYVTRGFYIEVTMDHRKMPELLGSLTNMPYPTVIARVQAVSRKHNQSEFASQGAAGPSRRGGGGRRSERDGEEEEETETPAKSAPGTPTPGQEDSLVDVLIDQPHMADVAIAGYMAIFKVETKLDELTGNEVVSAEGNDSSEQPGENSGDSNRSQPALNRSEQTNGRE